MCSHYESVKNPRQYSPSGELVHSFTMLTLNADAHPLMRQFHRSPDERRMVAILPKAHYADWLNAPAQHSRDWVQLYPAELLVFMTNLPIKSARSPCPLDVISY